jgi:hypothetical protein
VRASYGGGEARKLILEKVTAPCSGLRVAVMAIAMIRIMTGTD